MAIVRSVFPEYEPVETSKEASDLATFLHDEAQAIARRAASLILGGLPLLGGSAKRRLRSQLADQVLELSRHLEAYGVEGPRLYGESQRRYAASRLAEGMELHDALEERAIVQDAILSAWTEKRGLLPGRHARLLAQTFAELTSQAAEVWLTFQRAETVAFQEAALLDTIVHHLDEAILVVEPDGTISYATPALEQITGLPARIFVGVPPDRLASVFDRLTPRDREGNPLARADLPQSRALALREVQHEEFVRIRRMDGREAVCELYAAPVFTEDGQLRGAILTVRDRTQSFEQTEALEGAFNELRKMHARLLSRSRLEAVGELAGSAAHALNNQLNVITLRVRRLLEKPEAGEDAVAIERSVREIAALVARLQEFAAAPRQDHPVALDAIDVVETALDLVRARIGPAAAVQVETELEEAPPVLAERDGLLELLTALLLGAEDATPKGAAVLVQTVMEDDFVVIRVVDRGQTLTSEQVDQLFEPLLAEEAERALNLSMARQALHRWGGEVRVVPQEGGGNAIEVRLPVYEAPVAEAARPPVEEPPAPAPAGKRLQRVLVVDDDEDNAAMLADLVRDADVAVQTAGTGAEALRMAERMKPQAALVDLLLPDMKGWTVVEELKSRWPDIRVAVVSGLAVGQEERVGTGADAVFRKPIDTEALLAFLGL